MATHKNSDQRRNFIMNDEVWNELTEACQRIGAPSNSAIIRGLIVQFLQGLKETGGTPQYIPSAMLKNGLIDDTD